MKKGQRTQKKLEFRLKNNENRQKARLKSCFGALVGTNRDESAFWGRRAGRRVSVFKSGLSRRDRDGWQVCLSLISRLISLWMCPNEHFGLLFRTPHTQEIDGLTLPGRPSTLIGCRPRIDAVLSPVFGK